MPNKNRRKRRAKPKSPKKKSHSKEQPTDLSSLGSDGDKSPVPLLAELEAHQSSPPPSPTTATTDALASMNATNLYHLSLVCLSISLILFVSTYQMIVNNGGTVAVFGGPPALVPAEHPVVPLHSSDSSTDHNELLVGYKLLHHTLKKESQLKYVHKLRDATFRGPKGSLKSVMTTVYETSQTRFQELERLFVEATPTIAIKDAPQSAMGDSIQADVEQASTGELVPLPFSSSKSAAPPRLQWGLRFVFIQAQATRMVVALSTSLAKFEANQERKQWLLELADEFEDIRESLLESTLANLGEESWKA